MLGAPARFFKFPTVALAAVALALCSAVSAHAGQVRPGIVQGSVTTQGDVRLPGVTIRLLDLKETVVAIATSDEAGTFQLPNLGPGGYVITVTLPGFRDTSRSIVIKSADTLVVKIDLELEGITDTITVSQTAEPLTSISNSTGRSDTLNATTMEELPAGRDGLAAALATMAGVVRVPGGLSIRGGRPTQSSVQVGDANVVDASTGAATFRLPTDAVQSVEVLPNPYAVEFGRFSSGLTLIQTRSGGDRWRLRLNNFIPSLRPKRDALLAVSGIERFGPQFFVGGPLIKGRVFVMQSADYGYSALDIPSRPENEVKTSHSLNAFTRVDAHLNGSNELTASIHVLPQRQSAVNMDTFTPPEVAVDERDTSRDVIVSETASFSKDTLLTSMFQASHAAINIGDWNGSGMDILPQENRGRFFNAQDRRTNTYQWIESLSRSITGRTGEHFFKSGVDVLHATFDGLSRSAPVSIRRVDGTLARQLTFSGTAAQQVQSTDMAIFAQDRWRLPGGRLLVEAGARVDRDGLLGTTNLTSRAGGVLALNEAGTRALRGGFGLFYERTPSVVGAFDQFEVATDVRFASDGVTPLGPPITLTPRTDDHLRTPRSAVWNIGYDHQFNARQSLKIGYLARAGINEFIVEPVQTAEGTVLSLSSAGHSRYHELEVGGSTAIGRTLEVSGSYVRSSSRSDSNSYVSFFDALRAPVISTNAFAAAAGDTPNRFVGRVRLALGERWLVNASMEYRTGFPYSVVGADLDALSPRNQLRLPNTELVDLTVEHRVTLFGLRPWIGVRAYNALNRFQPSDVQRNVTAPDFGGFYDSRPRQIRLQLRFQ